MSFYILFSSVKCVFICSLPEIQLVITAISLIWESFALLTVVTSCCLDSCIAYLSQPDNSFPTGTSVKSILVELGGLVFIS